MGIPGAGRSYGGGNMTFGRFKALVPMLLAGTLFSAPSQAITLQEAIAVALESNPEIGQAIENREAIEFELRQARGLYLPSVDLEARPALAGSTILRAEALGIEDDALYPDRSRRRRHAEAVRQRRPPGRAEPAGVARRRRVLPGAGALRVHRARRRPGLSRIHAAGRRSSREAKKNLGFHQSILGDIREGIEGGALTEADRQQAEERLYRAQVARDRGDRGTRERRGSGSSRRSASRSPIPRSPARWPRQLPRSLDEAIGLARQNNPARPHGQQRHRRGLGR